MRIFVTFDRTDQYGRPQTRGCKEISGLTLDHYVDADSKSSRVLYLLGDKAGESLVFSTSAKAQRAFDAIVDAIAKKKSLVDITSIQKDETR
jgi:hypothetical protein